MPILRFWEKTIRIFYDWKMLLKGLRANLTTSRRVTGLDDTWKIFFYSSSPQWRLSRVDTTRAGGSCCRVVAYFPNVFRGSCARWAHQHFKRSQRFCLSFSRVTDLLRHPGKIDMRGERMRYHTDNFCCPNLHERVKHRWLRTPPRAFLLKQSIEGEGVATA